MTRTSSVIQSDETNCKHHFDPNFPTTPITQCGGSTDELQLTTNQHFSTVAVCDISHTNNI